MTKYILADQFFYTTEVKGRGYLALNDDGTFGEFQVEKPEEEVIDYTGFSIAPGLVDTHVHGFAGSDVMDNDSRSLQNMSETLLSCGVTSFLPTTLTASTEQLNAVCQTIAETHVIGAKIQGIFLEGPFFNPIFKGAQNPNYMCDPSIEQLTTWQTLSNGLVKKVALAPEKEGSIDFIQRARQQDVHVAIAHTNATYEEACQAVEAGATIFVHTFNGMKGLHHREPGVAGAALMCQGVHDELICDGHHLHPAMAKLVMDCNGRDHAVLITDCMAAGGQQDGDYHLGELEVTVKDGTARLKQGGSLAGSILQLYQAVQNVIDWGIATPQEAYRMASYNAAKSVGIEQCCGTLDQGMPADFIVVDSQYHLHATYLDGVQRYTAENALD